MSDILSQFSTKLKDIVFRFALGLLDDREAAKDTAQDVFEKLWKKRNTMETNGNIEALSIKITRDLCMDRLRHQSMKREKMKTFKNEKEHLYQKTGYDVMELAEITKELIRKLPEKQKMVIHLRDVEQYEFEEISEMMGIEIQAIRMNLSRARRTIKEKLEKITNYGLQ
jgi:RNA polymerase sigma factor (sigma-70 family)